MENHFRRQGPEKGLVQVYLKLLQIASYVLGPWAPSKASRLSLACSRLLENIHCLVNMKSSQVINGQLLNNVSGPSSIPSLICTHLFEQSMVTCQSKNRHQIHTCSNRLESWTTRGLVLQNLGTLILGSIVNTIRGTYMIVQVSRSESLR